MPHNYSKIYEDLETEGFIPDDISLISKGKKFISLWRWRNNYNK